MGHALGLDEMEQEDGIVIREAPQRIVEVAEDVARLWVPAPPEIGGKLVEAMQAARERRQGT